MKRLAGFVLSLALCTASGQSTEKIFDPARDAAADLKAAEQTAKSAHKNILLDVGGNWCSWCHILDKTISTTPALNDAVKRNFVVVHVNWSPEQENKEFLGHYGAIEGFPHLIVLSADGKVLCDTETDVFEKDHKAANGYSLPALQAFFEKYAPKQQPAA